jgi:NAD(P)H-dependent flavin oxidoreductase YrpB (nitropropane dioxygenase family)
VSALLERLGVERPLVQAGMGSGVSRHELAAAVSEAGGLGTIGILAPELMRQELDAARERTSKPVAVNLLLPFARRPHWDAVAGADVVFTFWGHPRRLTDGVWIHQCGSVEEAQTAKAAGADAVIAQGVEAGGHVRGTTPALDLLDRVRSALGADYPVLVAGGIADAADVRTALDAGATAAVLGTRFLMSDESRAHRAYKERLMESRETVLTDLFGAGWPDATHRVIWNEAAERWLTPEGDSPRGVRIAHSLVSPILSRVSLPARGPAARRMRASAPLLAPVPPTDDGPSALLDNGPLYAGETVARIHDVRPASELVEELSP